MSSKLLSRGKDNSKWESQKFKRALMPIELDCALGGAIIGRRTAKIAFLDRMAIKKGLGST